MTTSEARFLVMHFALFDAVVALRFDMQSVLCAAVIYNLFTSSLLIISNKYVVLRITASSYYIRHTLRRRCSYDRVNLVILDVVVLSNLPFKMGEHYRHGQLTRRCQRVI